MRSLDAEQPSLCSYSQTDDFVPAEYPLQRTRSLADAALKMLNRRPGKRRLTVGVDKNYGQRRFVEGARKANVTPHVAQIPGDDDPALIGARHGMKAMPSPSMPGIAWETPFGWGKFNRPLRQTMLRGPGRVGAQVKLVFASYNLVRIAALEAA